MVNWYKINIHPHLFLKGLSALQRLEDHPGSLASMVIFKISFPNIVARPQKVEASWRHLLLDLHRVPAKCTLEQQK